jgi:hypothetical protein
LAHFCAQAVVTVHVAFATLLRNYDFAAVLAVKLYGFCTFPV